MGLSVGIVGLPNVGKSTLFNALLKKQVADVAPYPFCTIEPNVGVVEVPDERLEKLANVMNKPLVIPAVVQFYDIAGLVKGAHKGEGLGNKFLAHIREVAAILHVVRLFENDSVAHVTKTIKPIDDIKTVETELMLADLATLEKQTKPKLNATKEEIYCWEVIQKLKKSLNQEIDVKKQGLFQEELKAIKHLNLLITKPVLFVFNISEKQREDIKETDRKIKEILKSTDEDSPYLTICAKLENEILLFTEDEQKEYLKHYYLKETGLNRLIKKAYKLLDLISFFTTTGGKEVRAWTIKKDTKAVKAAEVVHTDFAKHFIKADVILYEEFISCGSWNKAREAGKVQTVGKDYQIKDGEVIEFKIGV